MTTDVITIIPLYSGNITHEVKLAVRSMLRQTYKCDILIGVDGPIRSDLSNYLDSLKSVSIDVIYSKQRIGLANILNLLVSASLERGYKYIARMDGDDFSVKTRLAEQIAFLQSNALDAVGGQLIAFSKASRSRNHVRYELTHDGMINKFAAQCPIAHPLALFKASVFTKISYNDRYYLNEDYKLWLDFINNGLRFGNVNRNLLYFRFSDSTYLRRTGSRVANSELAIRLWFIFNRQTFSINDFALAIVIYLFKLMPASIFKRLYFYFR